MKFRFYNNLIRVLTLIKIRYDEIFFDNRRFRFFLFLKKRNIEFFLSKFSNCIYVLIFFNLRSNFFIVFFKICLLIISVLTLISIFSKLFL